MQDKGLPTEIENNKVEEEKQSIFHREKINLSDGHGALTENEKARLLAFSFANKYNLYIPQNNETLATCAGEYLDATRKNEVQEPIVETTTNQAPIESNNAEDATDAQLDLAEE